MRAKKEYKAPGRREVFAWINPVTGEVQSLCEIHAKGYNKGKPKKVSPEAIKKSCAECDTFSQAMGLVSYSDKTIIREVITRGCARWRRLRNASKDKEN